MNPRTNEMNFSYFLGGKLILHISAISEQTNFVPGGCTASLFVIK